MYTFIVLNTDKSVFEESYFSDECLAWFDAELNKATAEGKPVFVILHQPLKNTHFVWESWNSPDDNAGTVGKQSDALQAIMNKYNNKENTNVALGGGCGFSGLLTIAFIILKLCGVINWSWWLVLLPLIISIGLPIAIILLILL